MFHECENDQLMDRFNSWLLLDYHHIHAHTDMYDTQNSLNINNPLRPGSSAERYSALFSWFLRQLRARSPQSESATPWGDSHNCQRVKNRRSRIRRRTWTSDLLHRTQRKGGKTFYRHRQLQVLVSVQRDDVTDDTVIFTVWYFTSLLTNWQTSCVIRTEFKQDQHSIYLSSVTRIQRNVKVQFWVFPCSAASYFPSTRVSDSCNYQLICRQCL